MTASEYASYTFCSTDSANVSAKDVSSTNFVPIFKAKQSQNGKDSRWEEPRTSSGQKDSHFEGFPFDDLRS